MPPVPRALHLLLLCLLLAMPGHAGEMAVDVQKREIAIALTTEPPSLNSFKATDGESSRILDHISEGLMGYDVDNRLSGGVAERWELRPQGATFHLRRNALWDDGVAVTANDFVFAWREVVRPANAAEYAPLMFPIRNARRINGGELEAEMLGVRALDDHTLEVEFEEPCAYFLGLTAYITYRPIREDVYRRFGERYAAEAGNLRSNGAFRLSEWVHGARLRLERNPQYWNAAAIELNAINVPYITEEPSSTFNLFKDGKIAIASLDAATMREALARRMNVKRFTDGTVNYIEFNHRLERPTRNLHLRKALQLAFDVDTFVARIVRIPGNEPMRSLLPSWTQGERELFRQEHPPRALHSDIAAARHQLELARQELGEIPALVLLLGDTPAAGKQAEYLQDLFQRTLGLELKLDKQVFKQRLAKMTAGDFDMVASAWGPDYDDPLTYADLFASWNMNNRGRYRNPEYDRMVSIAQRSVVASERNAAFARIQDIVIEDAVIIAMYERGFLYVQHPQLSGVKRRVFGGDPNYMYSRINQ
ncbi:MAG: peptide ABC transporter substrate-binding protein [Pseudomonadales bacterium]|nr:peptide ABC transporter substrate-binding protein [Pseudomonadales bacterium]